MSSTKRFVDFSIVIRNSHVRVLMWDSEGGKMDSKKRYQATLATTRVWQTIHIRWMHHPFILSVRYVTHHIVTDITASSTEARGRLHSSRRLSRKNIYWDRLQRTEIVRLLQFFFYRQIAIVYRHVVFMFVYAEKMQLTSFTIVCSFITGPD